MKTVYYSEELKKYFTDKDECEKAEKEFEEKHALELKAKEERKKRAQEVNDAYAHYMDLRNAFIKDYKEFHMTYRSDDEDGYKSLFEYFFNL